MAADAAALRAEFESLKTERRDSMRAKSSKLFDLANESRPPDLNLWAAKWTGTFADRFATGFVPSWYALEAEVDEAHDAAIGVLAYVNSRL